MAGRYTVYAEIGAGAAGSVHLARLEGIGGFARTVVIKKMHRAMAGDPALVATFVDEARMASRIHHPNVVATLDVLAEDGEVAIVMDYVEGVSLEILNRHGAVPSRIAATVVTGFLSGLQAAHDATDERGEALELVHRDVSPQNILVGVDGIARILDFGIAKATGRLHVTRTGVVKGKLSYMPPEQLYGESIDARSDIYAAGVVLWEALTGKRLFAAATETETLSRILEGQIPAPSDIDPELRPFDDVVLRAISRNADERFDSARSFAIALGAITKPASPSDVGAWVESLEAPLLAERAKAVAAMDAKRPRRWPLVAGALAFVACGAVAVAVRPARPPDTVTVTVTPPPPSSDPPVVSASEEVEQAPAPVATHHRPPRPHKPAAVDCSLPYVLDMDGHKHYRAECVR